MPKTVLARIKRFGNQFASCGIPLRPGPMPLGKRFSKALCPKLVPGQVVEVLEDSNLLNQDCIEIVRRVEADEILRPLVFRTPEEAVLADPSKSRMSAEHIAAALAFSEGAKQHQAQKLRQRQETASAVLESAVDRELLDVEENERRSQNRVLRADKDDATPRSVADDLDAAARVDAALGEQKDGPVSPPRRRFRDR